MSRSSGLFITFEGLDGSGKSTHLKRVAARFEALGRQPLVTREPGGTALGDALRRIHLYSEHAPADGIVEALIMFASRRQLIAEIIAPALEDGELVLCDRFSDSSFAYQGFGRRVGLDEVLAIDRVATGGLRPDRTLLFDLPASVARQRGQSSERRESGEADRLDVESLAFYERVRDGYRVLAEQDTKRYRVIDSSGSTEATWKHVEEALSDLLDLES